MGNAVYVSGTTATKDGAVVGQGDATAQTRRILEIISAALAEAGATLADVVRVRVFVTDIVDWPQVGQVLGEVFGDIRPANTLVAVSALIDPAMLVEIEADAVIGTEGGSRTAPTR